MICLKRSDYIDQSIIHFFVKTKTATSLNLVAVRGKDVNYTF